jgi:transcriptional regulator with XRE-family HTH domain
MNPIYKELGRLILNARNDVPMSQDALSKRVGLSRTSVTNIENGRQQVPLHMIYSFADALGITPSDLLPDRTKLAAPANVVEINLDGLSKDVADFIIRNTQPKKA